MAVPGGLCQAKGEGLIAASGGAQFLLNEAYISVPCSSLVCSGRQRRPWAQGPAGVYHQRCDDQRSTVERRAGRRLLQDIPSP